MSFTESIRSGLGQYATFGGRASRSEFWWFTLFMFLASIASEIVDLGLGFTGDFTPVSYLVSFGLLLPSLAVTVRRLHDIGRAGWWVLWYFLATMLAVVLFAVGVFLSLDAEAEFVFSPVGALLMVGGAAGLVATVIVWLVMMIKAGDAGPNQYGPPRSRRTDGHAGGAADDPAVHAPGRPGPGVYPGADVQQYPPPPYNSQQ